MTNADSWQSHSMGNVRFFVGEKCCFFPTVVFPWKGVFESCLAYATVGRALCIWHQLLGSTGANAPSNKQYVHVAFQSNASNEMAVVCKSKENSHHLQSSLKPVCLHQKRTKEAARTWLFFRVVWLVASQLNQCILMMIHIDSAPSLHCVQPVQCP